IACPWGGPAETVRHGETGLHVNPLDSGALAASILRLAGDPGLRAKLAAAGATAAGAYLAPRFVERVERVYDKIFERV
ncbi:MAG TPA: hypothetical protein VFV50_15840, partial [Bdellovibrionales bacterium]|nr:hypothetical protein [Bdellovibrionales bacterium]